jgi:hypothetical protein
MKHKQMLLYRLLTLGVVVCFALSVTTHFAHKGLWLRGGEFDAGKVHAGSRIAHVVSLVNLSPDPVSVSATPSCGCTLVEEKPYVVRPFGAMDYHIGVNVGASQPKAYKRTITLYCMSGSRAWTQTATVRYTVQ